jgi:hypothetical protein
MRDAGAHDRECSRKAGTPPVEVEASLFSDPARETMSGNPDVNFHEERAMVIAADYPCDSSPSTGLNTSQERGTTGEYGNYEREQSGERRRHRG